MAEQTVSTSPLAIVTHSQGGLILQRYLAWMLAEGKGRQLGGIRLIVMLSCPNEGSEYLRSIRVVAGFGHHPQAGQLDVLARQAGEDRRVVLRQIVNATTLDDRHCPIPVFVYSGRTDNVVSRESAQSVFPNTQAMAGVRQAVSQCQYRVLVLTPEESTVPHDAKDGPGPDTLHLRLSADAEFMLGLMTGVLGVEHTFIVVPEDKKDQADLTSLLAGIVLATYDPRQVGDGSGNAMGVACVQIAQAVLRCERSG